MKRIFISVLLIASILSSAFVVSASSPLTAKNTDEVIDFLKVFGIEMNETENIERAVTKAELVDLVMQTANKKGGGEASELAFWDVKEDFWAHDSIAMAKKLGIVQGHTDGAFGINDTVSTGQALIIAMRALGFSRDYTDTDLMFGYSQIYNKLGSGIAQKDKITVADAYVLAYNMLHSQYPEVVTIGNESDGFVGEYEINNKTMYMEYAFDTYKARGRITGNKYTKLGLASGALAKSCVQIDSVTYRCDIDTMDTIGYTVDFYARKTDDDIDEIVYISVCPQTEITEIDGEDIVSIGKKGDKIIINYYDENERKKSVSIPVTSDFIYNGKKEHFTEKVFGTVKNNKCAAVTIAEYDGTYVMNVSVETIGVVRSVNTFKESIMLYDGTEINCSQKDDDLFLNVVKNDEAAEYAQLKRYDVLIIRRSIDEKICSINACDYTLSGKVTAQEKGESIWVDGAEYETTEYFETLYKNSDLLGTSNCFLFDVKGRVAFINTEAGEFAGEYGFLVNAACGDVIKGKCEVLIYTADGEMKAFELKELVRFNNDTKKADDVVNYIAGGSKVKRSLVRYSKDSNGFIDEIYTPEGNTDVLKIDATIKERRFLSPMFSDGVGETDIPVFYIDDDTVLIFAPDDSASDSDFEDENNYRVMKAKSYFINYSLYEIEAYNFNKNKVAGCIVLRDIVELEVGEGTERIVIKEVKKRLNSNGESCAVLVGYNGNGEIEVELKEEDQMYYMVGDTKVKFKKGDIAYYQLNNNGLCVFLRYSDNIYSSAKEGTYSGKTNSRNFLVSGVVTEVDSPYMTVRLDDGREVCIFNIGAVSPVVCDVESGRIYSGTSDYINPGDFVYTRSSYSFVYEIFVIKQ